MVSAAGLRGAVRGSLNLYSSTGPEADGASEPGMVAQRAHSPLTDGELEGRWGDKTHRGLTACQGKALKEE